MPFQIGSVAVHDDGQHFGSARRDVANGVAGLSASGYLLVPGYGVILTRDVDNNVHIYERTSSELICYFNRVAATDYVGRIMVGGVYQVLQHAGFKDVANGIAGLDASAEITSRLAYENVASGVAGLDAGTLIPLALIPAALTGKKTDLNAVISVGSYVGNLAVNRAIAHGLGCIPKLVLLKRAGYCAWFGIVEPGRLGTLSPSASVDYAVTAPDVTNFYVGNATDYGATAQNEFTYYWVAIG